MNRLFFLAFVSVSLKSKFQRTIFIALDPFIDMPKVKITTINVVHKMEEKQIFPVSLLNEKPKEECPLASNLNQGLKCDDRPFSKTVKNSLGEIIQFAGGVVLYLIDFLITFCQSEWVRNVLVVFLTVSLEAFVVMVLAICTVLTTMIVNAEDAYKSYNGGIGGTTTTPDAEEEITEQLIYSQDSRTLNNIDSEEEIN